MQKRIFILCDSDSNYVNRFMNYSRRRASFPFQVRGFTKAESVADYLEGGSADAALIAWDLWRDWDEERKQRVEEAIPCLMLLNQDRRAGQKELPSFYKYQSMDGLLREILSEYERLERDREEDHSIELIGFYSPVGHCGKTTAAVHLGQMLAEKEDQEILYVNMEPLGTWVDEASDRQHSLSDVLYERAMKGEVKLAGVGRSYGRISAIAPVVNPEDWWKVPGEQRESLLQELRGIGIYDRILVDLPSDSDPVPLLAVCDRIILVRRQGVLMEHRMGKMKKYLARKMNREDWKELVIPEFPVLKEKLPGSEGSLCRELEEWIWTQWSGR